MQASKIQIGTVYAIYRPDVTKNDEGRELVRLRVTAVTTTRHRNTGSPHDYKSMVEGVIIEDHPDRPQWAENAEHGVKNVTYVTPDALLGPYQEHLVLVERKQRETTEKIRRETEEKETVSDLRRVLYALVGEPMPNDENDYKQMFRNSHGGSISVSKEGARQLLASLKAKQ
jgi:hypothetical protein